MKKIVTFILLTCMVLTLAACADNGSKTSEGTTPETTAPESTTPEHTTPEITMQEIYDATKTETMLKNHQSISIRDEMDGEFFSERYQTKEYIYDYFPGVDEESDFAEFITEDAYYCYMDGGYLRYLSIAPDGVSDFASLRERYGVAILGEDILNDTIESVSKKDGHITVKSVCDQDALTELGVASAKFEYILDAKTREIISFTSDYVLDDGTVYSTVTEVTYDTEAPEILKTFLKYANQTEDLRNITVVSNPGTDNEKSESIQVPKDLIIGFRYDEDSEYEFELYTDAACTELYDPYVNTDSDLTVYVKWAE